MSEADSSPSHDREQPIEASARFDELLAEVNTFDASLEDAKSEGDVSRLQETESAVQTSINQLLAELNLDLSETKRAEVKTNLEFWQELGVEVNEADIRKKIKNIPEVEGFDHYIYVPKGIKLSEPEF